LKEETVDDKKVDTEGVLVRLAGDDTSTVLLDSQTDSVGADNA